MKPRTLLTTISTRTLTIKCHTCGHCATLTVQDMIERLGHGAAVSDVLANDPGGNRVKSRAEKRFEGQKAGKSDTEFNM